MGTEAINMLKQYLVSGVENLVTKIADNTFNQLPGLKEKYENYEKEKALEDITFHLDHLFTCYRLGKPKLFNEYVSWTRSLLETRGITRNEIKITFETMKNILFINLPERVCVDISEYFELIEEKALNKELKVESLLNFKSNLEDPLAVEYLDAILNKSRREATDLILNALNIDYTIKDLYLRVFQPVQYEIGRLWQLNEISVAKEHFCTATTQMIISNLYPYIFSTETIDKTVIATSVSKDLHEVGIRMVADFFEMEGWNTYFLGANTPLKSVINEIKEKNADLLAVSATLIIYVESIQDIIHAIKSENMDVKILVGGFPFNFDPNLWQDIGADAFASDAESAISIANNLIN
ncbi:MAG: cobalamin-binding protein [Candidatus Lokiarchaeota archaeon]|nr:cobalamin-binding protein [Candidatus Lokiarchaeota archaeon]